MSVIAEVRDIFLEKKSQIEKRLKDFEKKGKTDKKIFEELVFCLLTPQSRAKNCWKMVGQLKKKGLLWNGNAHSIANELKGVVRFHNKKASFIIEARKMFSCKSDYNIKSKFKSFGDVYELREWLAGNIKGFGYKEASHFLRNIGMGEKLAILDRHILKNLKLAGVIKDLPSSLTKKQYLNIEKKMLMFAHKIGIPIAVLDLVLWCKETGEIFK